MKWTRPQSVRRRLETLGDQPLINLDVPQLRDIANTDAAVLIPLYERDGQMQIIFTERSETLRNHSGEISFPGGRADDADPDLRCTALRECEEELCIPTERVRVFGPLLRMPTITGFRVTAFVAEMEPDVELIPNPDEIARVITADLVSLADPSIHRVETWEHEGRSWPVHYFEYEDATIWGATGLMLHRFLQFIADE